ncbi:uncharacterized protein LOC108683264 [Hyalella azteca]|uniref:Uncharacterized protein LOC108683264 n=1 Tax=Hyalella azteca TaxID=294128 RepID=A0A8B7PPC3_HYAAZ|nr:uncharacterized protein LOC108683264 [Hyalella azteca]
MARSTVAMVITIAWFLLGFSFALPADEAKQSPAGELNSNLALEIRTTENPANFNGQRSSNQDFVVSSNEDRRRSTPDRRLSSSARNEDRVNRYVTQNEFSTSSRPDYSTNKWKYDTNPRQNYNNNYNLDPNNNVGADYYTNPRSNFSTNFKNYNTNLQGQQYQRIRPYSYDSYVTRTGSSYPYAPPRQSFQSSSYVHDKIPKTIFKSSDFKPSSHPVDLPFEWATVTEKSNVLVKPYFDKFDENQNLSKIQERVKIFYGGNMKSAPQFRNMQREQQALEQQKKLYRSFKTQRANQVLKTQSE